MNKQVKAARQIIVFTVLFLLGLWFLYQIRNILVMLFIAFILMSAISPLVHAAQKIKIPMALTIFVIYILIISLLVSTVASIVPMVADQTRSLINHLPKFITTLDREYNLRLNSDFLTSSFNQVPSNLFKIAAGAFSNILNIFAVLFMTYYLILEREHMHQYLTHFFGIFNAEKQAERFVRRLEQKIGSWVNGQLVLMFVIGVATYFGLSLLKIPYALPLAFLAGFLEIVPNIGPTLAAIPTILIGLTVSPFTALGAAILSILIQQIENNLIVPQVMKHAVGIRPLVTITVLFTGLSLAGVIGAVLAIPCYLTIETIFEFKKEVAHAQQH